MARVLETGEADVPELPRLARLHQRGVGALVVEDPVRVLVADDLVVLDEVDPIRPEAPQRLVELPRGLRLRPAAASSGWCSRSWCGRASACSA
jgi:predicted metalloprotease